MTRLIRVPPGIGDSIWILQKLINSKEKFDFHITDAFPQRGKQIFDLLPQVSNSCEYVPGLSYGTIKALAKQNPKLWQEHREKAFTLECNTHLEAGKRIEDYLPDLTIKYKLPYKTSDTEKALAAQLLSLQHANAGKYLGIYCSSYATSKNHGEGFWGPNEWYDFVEKIHLENPLIIFVMIGAEWDTDLTGMLMTKMLAHRIPFINTVGENLGTVIEILKRLDYFIGFPSGLSIINETLHKKTYMFYPTHLIPLSTAWPEESRIKSGDYIPVKFCTPAEAFKILMDKNGLQL